MLGKLIAHAPTRAEAIAQLAGALDRLQLLGLPTNRTFLAACLRHETFANGLALIPFLSEQADAIRTALHHQEQAAREEAAQAVVWPAGRSPIACAWPRPARLRHRGEVFAPTATTHSRATAVRADGNRWHVQAGATDLFIDDISLDPPEGAGGGAGGNELRAPFNGKVVGLPVQPGTAVAQGDVLVVVESMKLAHSLCAARAGVVAAVAVDMGQQVAPGQVLVTLEPA